MKPQKYKFMLPVKERVELLRILDESTCTVKQKTRARILLEMDYLYYFRCQNRPQEIIASRCDVSTSTVYAICKKYIEEGLNAAISRKKRVRPPVGTIITADKQAELIALACSAPPDGHNRWTLRLLEIKAVELGIVERVSDTTIGRLLKKNHITLS